jgi:hypothetical protein
MVNLRLLTYLHVPCTGFARVVCIGFHREAAAPSAAPERVLFVPVHSTRPIEAPVDCIYLQNSYYCIDY